MNSGFTRADWQLRALLIEQARMRGAIEKMVTRDEFQTGINLILSRFDAFTDKWEDNRYQLAKHGERLDDLEKRLFRIEPKFGS